jgi:hypothetical protein
VAPRRSTDEVGASKMNGRNLADRDDEGVLEAARAIRPYLADLVGPTVADRLDRRIADLLTGAEEQAIPAALLSLLEEQQDTAWFLGRVLDDRPRYRPPYVQGGPARDIASPAGDLGGIEADRYACPLGDYVWYRPDVGTEVPACPDHRIPLVRN